MMISPEQFANQYRDCSLMELAVRRDELHHEIRDLREGTCTSWSQNEETIDISLTGRAKVLALYLEALDELIATKEADMHPVPHVPERFQH